MIQVVEQLTFINAYSLFCEYLFHFILNIFDRSIFHLSNWDVIGMTRVIGLAFIYFMLLNYRLKIYTPVSLLIICSGRHIGIVKNYLFVYKFLEKFKSSAVHKNTLKAMPFRMADLPEFIAFTAMVYLNIVLNNIDGQMDLLNNESPEVRLESMQFMRDKLNSVLKDQCAEANAKIAHANDVGFHDTARYHG